EIGHPLACDAIYGNALPVYLSSIKKKYKLSKNEEAETPIINRLALHAAKLNFKLQNGKYIQLETPVPKEFRALMQQLKKLH
ncbi:MAG: RNA pseudouridine synthase, partial [Ferruginibacter sp.]